MNIEDVIKRVKKRANVKTYKDMAKLFGVSPTDFSNRKKRGTLLALIIDWAIHENVSIDWLLTGKSQLSDNKNSLKDIVNANILYENNGNVKVIQNGGALKGESEDRSLKAIRLLTRIMEYGNPTMISAAINHLETLVTLIEDSKKT